MKHVKQIIFFLATICIGKNIVSSARKIVYCFTNYDEKSFWEEKGDFFKAIFEPKYTVKFTSNLKSLKNYKYIITLEVPHSHENYKNLFNYPQENVLLFSFEGQITHPLSHEPRYHDCYSKIFTWNDCLIDNKRYFKTLFPFSDPLPLLDLDPVPFEQKKLCVLMGTHNVYQHPIENYSGRVNIINFFEKISEDDFDFYGYGWSNNYKNWKGFIPWDKSQYNEPWINFTYSRRLTKINTIKNYKFDIVYENCKDQYGYLTERLFDTFAAGCVPIYWGSKNIDHYIPINCLIMRNDFANNHDLYNYLKNMSEEEYEQYQDAIKNFLSSKEVKKLKTDYFIKCIKNILDF